MKLLAAALIYLVSMSGFAGTLYSSPSCTNCIIAKKVLNQNCIKYETININAGNKYGIEAVPAYDTGSQRLVGLYEIKAWAKQNSQCNK